MTRKTPPPTADRHPAHDSESDGQAKTVTEQTPQQAPELEPASASDQTPARKRRRPGRNSTTTAANKKNGHSPLPPGSIIGILGSGQLGRMMALAAAPLGYRVHVFGPGPDSSGLPSPCGQVCDTSTEADYVDQTALTAFAESVDVITYEFENLPLEALKWLSQRVPMRPGTEAIKVAQDREAEKEFLDASGIPIAPWRRIENREQLSAALKDIGRPAVLKSARWGYDGKGQVRIDDARKASTALRETGGGRAILEGWVDFERELSVVIARGINGEIIAYPPVENRHENHILRETIAPAIISREQTDKAISLATRIANELSYTGVMAVEMFALSDGKLLVNEIAPRPHNSGHWSIDACPTGQFEQHIRAICGLPLGPVEPLIPCRMRNLLGDEADAWLKHVSDGRAKLHLYGKGDMRPGRKMGHVTHLLRPDSTRN